MSTTAPLNPATWMSDLWPVIGERPLMNVTVPGTHDAGIWKLTHPTAFSTKCNTQTQSFDIATQLAQGVRYFDLRPTIWDKIWYFGHFSNTHVPFVGWQGSTGGELDEALKAVATFASLAASNKELIVLKFSHFLNHDTNKEFSEADKIALRDKVIAALGSQMIVTSDVSVRLGSLKLSSLVASGRTVLCVFEDFENLISPSRGIYAFGDPDGLVQHTGGAPSIGLSSDGRIYSCYYTDDSSRNLRVISSADGGTTWSPPFTTQNRSTQVAPAIAVPSNGTVDVLYVANDKGKQLLLTQSKDRGETWANDSTLNGVSAKFTPGFTANGDILSVVYVEDHKENQLRYTRSSNAGVSWSTAIGLGTRSSKLSPSLVTLPDGRCFVLYVANDKDNGLLLAVSTDGGQTWRKDDYGLTGQSTKQPPTLAIDSSGKLYAVYVSNDKDNRLLLTTSTNSGQSWSTPTRVGTHLSERAPALTIGRAGELQVLYIPIRDGEYIGRTMSTDGGVTWSGLVDVRSDANFAIYDVYSDSSDVDYVISNQIEKYKNFSSRYGSMFLLSWTATSDVAPLTKCIEELAVDIDARLTAWMTTLIEQKAITSTKKPNVLYLDYYDNTRFQFIDTVERVNRA